MLAAILSLCLLISALPVTALAADSDIMTLGKAKSAVAELNAKAGSDFYYELVEKYADSDIEHRTEVRWWMAEGAHTDQTLKEEVQAIYNAGFRGIELAQLNETSIDASIYAYGSEQWNHDFKLVLDECLTLGMTVGITSGTNWNTTNVPGLDPNSQAAMQGVFAAAAQTPVSAGSSYSGPLPNATFVPGSFFTPDTWQPVNENALFIGAYAFKVVDATDSPIRVSSTDFVDLKNFVTEDEEGNECLEWTAPDDGDYCIFSYWQQGTAQKSDPAVEPSYCVNYFDKRGVEAFQEYFAAKFLDDPELNAKIKDGDVQLFMDSLEINRGICVTYWSEDFAEEFMARKHYDIRPYLFLNMGLPAESELARWSPEPPAFGTYNVENDELGMKILNDLRDVHTQLYMENYMTPMREWLNGYGIKLRAQISYGRYFEISEPILTVDYPEAENLNQRNQVDIYRLWTGGSKLQNKILSSETGALAFMGYSYEHQRHLQEAYSLYAAGFSRINWHIWSSSWAPESTAAIVHWPGFQSWGLPFANLNFNVLDTRLPEYDTYDEFNQHLGRIQELLREGVSRTDVGMLWLKYDQHIASAVLAEDDMWMQRHDYMLFPSTELQENGYTYDYFSPEFLNAKEVGYNPKTGTLEMAGYKALVLWQNWLDVKAAQNVLDLAKQGMKVVIVDGAAVQTPYKDGREEELAAVMPQLKALDTVKTAATADDVLEALQTLGVKPYAGFVKENQQLLTQVRGDEDGNRYLYVYNYCDGTVHDGDDPDHGTNAKAEIAMDGQFIPYKIDAWTGEVTQLAAYRYENGKTIISVDLDYGDIALYAFEAVKTEGVHLVFADADVYTAIDGSIILRATKSGTYTAKANDGTVYKNTVAVPDASDITGWTLTVEAWSASEEKLTRTDTFTDSKGNTSVEFKYDTVKTNIDVQLDKLTTWDKISEVGLGVSGKGYYIAQFQWDGTADGAYLDFGSIVGGMEVTVNGQKTADLNMNIPVLDISDYLVIGTNTVELEYNSNLANELLETGILSERATDWAGYNVTYRSYGPAQAKLVPYVEVNVSDETALYYVDVNSDSPYAEAIANLFLAGIAKGTGNSKFNPAAIITTAELCVFLGRIDNVVVDNGGASGDGWSTGYVAWAKEAGFISGKTQVSTLTVKQVNNILSAYCASKGIDAVAAASSTRGGVAVALNAIYTSI